MSTRAYFHARFYSTRTTGATSPLDEGRPHELKRASLHSGLPDPASSREGIHLHRDVDSTNATSSSDCGPHPPASVHTSRAAQSAPERALMPLMEVRCLRVPRALFDMCIAFISGRPRNHHTGLLSLERWPVGAGSSVANEFAPGVHHPLRQLVLVASEVRTSVRAQDEPKTKASSAA